MIANALNHCRCARVADAETFTGHAVDVRLSAGSAVQGNVSNHDVIFCLKFHIFRRIYDQLTAGQTFSEVVIAVATKLQGQALRNEGAKALSTAAVTLNGKGILRQSVRILSGNLGTKNGSQGTVYVGDIYLQALLLSLVQGGF